MKTDRIQQGFALLEVFLAIILLGIISYASYAMVTYYQTKNLVQNFQADAVNIAQGLVSVINDSDANDSNAFIKNNQLWTVFTKETHIPNSHLNCTQLDPVSHQCLSDYVYLKSGFTVNDANGIPKQSIVNFALIPMSSNPSTNYLVFGLTMSQKQLSILIQNPSYGMGIFYAVAGQGLKESQPATQIPVCNTGPNATCVYSVYLTVPYNDQVSDFSLSGDFVTQAPV